MRPIVTTSLAAAGLALVVCSIWARLRRREAPASSPRRRGWRALQEALALRQAFQSRMGLDIGGTLAKLVFASEGPNPLEHVTLTTSTAHPELAFHSDDVHMHFVTTPTHLLESTCRTLRDRMGWRSDDDGNVVRCGVSIRGPLGSRPHMPCLGLALC